MIELSQPEQKLVQDPFSRPLPKDYVGEPISFLSKSDFPGLRQSEPASPIVSGSQLKSSDTPAQILPDPDASALEDAASYHTACIRALPRLTVTALRTLVDVAVTQVGENEVLPKPVVGLIQTRTALAAYARAVIAQLSPQLARFPAPIVAALAGCGDLSLPPSFSCNTDPSFPSVEGRPWSLDSSTTSSDYPRVVLPQRLSNNLESVWDEFLVLQRQFHGQVSGIAPGILDTSAALKAMGRLHPAAVDLFTARLLGMVADAAVTGKDGDPPKMRQLNERLRGVNHRMGSRHGGAKGGQKGGGVVLHRLPEVVRKTFANDPMQLFVLDFLTTVDSGRLTAALLPRVAAALKGALTAAAAATSNSSFTDAIVDARLFARLLALTMHAPNWAYSEYALDGVEKTDAARTKTRVLDQDSLLRRALVCSPAWTAALDVSSTLQSAVQSGQELAVIATVAIADVMLRLAAVDPIARETEWYRNAVYALRRVKIQGDDGRPIESESGISSMPLLDFLVTELEESEASPLNLNFVLRGDVSEDWTCISCSKESWTMIGDVRLIRECCPSLDELRRLINAPRSVLPAGRKTGARRITPLETTTSSAISSLSKRMVYRSSQLHNAEIQDPPMQTGNKATNDIIQDRVENDVEAALRHEFYRRMDGRLRELIQVVATSKPVNGTAAVDAYTKIARMLYPATPHTVIAVAAHMCGRQVDREKGQKTFPKRAEGSESRDQAMESRRNGVTQDGEAEGDSKESDEVVSSAETNTTRV